jgi:hypothetical protein
MRQPTMLGSTTSARVIARTAKPIIALRERSMLPTGLLLEADVLTVKRRIWPA